MGHTFLVHHKPHHSHTLYLTPHTFMLPGWPQRHLSLQHRLCCFLSFSSFPDSQILLVKCFFILLQNSPVKNWLFSWENEWLVELGLNLEGFIVSEHSLPVLLHFIKPERGGTLPWRQARPMCAEASVVTPVHTSGLVSMNISAI